MALTVVALVDALVEVVLGASLVGVAWALLVGTMVVVVLGAVLVDVMLASLGKVVSAMLVGLAVGRAVARVMGAGGGGGGDGGVWVMGGDSGGSLLTVKEELVEVREVIYEETPVEFPQVQTVQIVTQVHVPVCEFSCRNVAFCG